MISLYNWLNIISPTMFLVGIGGIITGKLSATPDLPIVGRQARITGVILAAPFIYQIQFTLWWKLWPVVIGCVAALLYLYATGSVGTAQVYKFWGVALAPPLICLWVTRILWNQVYVVAEAIHLTGWVYTYSPFFVFEAFLPIAVIFTLNLLIPVADSKFKYIWFGTPLLLSTLHYAVVNWYLPYLEAIEWPEGPFAPSIGWFFLGDVLLSTLVFVMAASAARLSHQLRLKCSS